MRISCCLLGNAALFVVQVRVEHGGQLGAVLDALVAQNESARADEPDALPPGAEHSSPVRLQEQAHHKQRFRDSALAVNHLEELLCKDRNREPLWIYALENRPLFKRIHDVGNPDLARTLDGARIT